jgi:transposase
MEHSLIPVPLSDDDWQRVSHLFIEDSAPRFGQARRPAREVLNGVLWILMNQSSWRSLPATFPPHQTCYMKYLRWKRAGVLDKALAEFGISREGSLAANVSGAV